MTDYHKFLQTKVKTTPSSGFNVEPEELNPMLFDYQKDLVKWSLKKGRACIFADCGLGKTAMQLDWANQINRKTNKPVLILTPLAVSEQTKAEGDKFEIPVNIVKDNSEIINGINITNYEKLDKFDCSQFSGVVLDESSILKSFSGKTRDKLIEKFKDTDYKLCCTATPAPNDYMELGNHCEFLGIMDRSEMLSMFFFHDGSNTSKWILKGHAKNSFWEWLSSWAIMLTSPKDLGYNLNGFDLPKLNLKEIVIDKEFLFPQTLTLRQRQQARRDTIKERCQKAIEIAKEITDSNEQCLIWCDLNAESETIHKGLDNSKEIKGSTKEKVRTETMLGFSNSEVPVLVTKPSIAGFGMNWQNCHNMIFVGLSDSYEKFYQAIRRCWRFGQTEEVNVYIIISSLEGTVLENIKRKEEDALRMQLNMKKHINNAVRDQLNRIESINRDYHPKLELVLPKWKEFYESTQSVC